MRRASTTAGHEAALEGQRQAARRALSDRGNYTLTDGYGYSVFAQRPDGLDCAVVTPWRGHRNCTFAVRLVPGAPHRLSVRILE